MTGTSGPLHRLRVNPGIVWAFSSWRTYRIQQRRSGINIGGAVITCYRRYSCGTIYELGARICYVRDMEERNRYFILILILIYLCVCHRFGTYHAVLFLFLNMQLVTARNINGTMSIYEACILRGPRRGVCGAFLLSTQPYHSYAKLMASRVRRESASNHKSLSNSIPVGCKITRRF